MTTDDIAQTPESSGAAPDPWESLATLGSVWSAYQSGLWNGIQTFRLAESTVAGRRAEEKAVYANQLRGIDLILFEAYLRALGDT